MYERGLLQSLASTSASVAKRPLPPSATTALSRDVPYAPADRRIRPPSKSKRRTQPMEGQDFRRASREAREKINVLAAGEAHGWKHTRSLRGNEHRLKDRIKVTQASSHTITSGGELEAPPIEDDEDYGGPGIALQPGDFVEVRRNLTTSVGIVLGMELDFSRERYILLTSMGNILKPYKGDVMFHIPGFITPELAHRCGTTSDIAMEKPQILARVQAVQRCREFEKQLEDKISQFSSKMSKLYLEVASPDPDQWSSLTINEAVSFIGKDGDQNSLTSTFAMHRCMVSRPLHFLADQQYQSTLTFHVRPRSHVSLIKRVTEMCRPSYRAQGLDTFAARALPIIQANRERIAKLRDGPPSASPLSSPIWTPTDAIFLEFLKLALRPLRSTQSDPYQMTLLTILKALYPTEQVISEDCAYQTLVDLGVFAPWQDPTSLLVDLPVSLHPRDISGRQIESAALVERGLAARTTASVSDPMGPEDFYARDPLDAIRHDFGNLPVYVIDDFGAHELDDGVSIERIPGEPGSRWLHVHVANPTSLLPPTHAFAQHAREMGLSMYLIQGSEFMLPASFASQFSLGEQAKKGLPEKVMTFSAKIDANGNLIDYKVQAGAVKNIRTLLYDNVDQALGKPLLNKSFPLGGLDPRLARLSLDGFDENVVSDLRDIEAIAKQMVQKRTDNGVFMVSTQSATIQMNPPGFTHPHPFDKPHEYNGFPELSYSVSSTADVDSGARSIVAEAMKIAGRVASMFLRDKGIPSLRRQSAPMVAQPMDSTENDFMPKRDPHTGYIDERELATYRVNMHPASYALHPIEHWALGIDAEEGYCRVTSPLRRYSDLVCHWNLHQALLGLPAPVHPSLSADWLDELTVQLPLLERRHKALYRQHEKFWQAYALQRFMQKPDGQEYFSNLEGFRFGTIGLNPTSRVLQSKARVPSLGLKGILQGLTDTNKATSLGQILPMSLTSVEVGMRPAVFLKLC